MAQFILDSNTPMKAYWRWGIVLVALSAGVLGAAPATVTLAGTPDPATFGSPVTLTALAWWA